MVRGEKAGNRGLLMVGFSRLATHGLSEWANYRRHTPRAKAPFLVAAFETQG
jgi:hypothetical protein